MKQKPIRCNVNIALVTTNLDCNRHNKTLKPPLVYNLTQNDVWLIRRLFMSAKASVKLNRGLRYHKSGLSSAFVCCDEFLFTWYNWLCRLVFETICWGPGNFRLWRRFICGLCKELVMSYTYKGKTNSSLDALLNGILNKLKGTGIFHFSDR